MGRVIVIQFTTLDGIVEDPDGSDGTELGGWAMRHGPQAIAGDKFRLGPLLDRGTLLFGRRTWDHFSNLWPPRDDPFARAMNGARKAVLTHRDLDEAQWPNSRAITGTLEGWIAEELRTTDVVVVGSESIVTSLAAEDRVDEYRLLIFPTVLGHGRRLFQRAGLLRLVSSEQVGPAVLAILEREGPGTRAV